VGRDCEGCGTPRGSSHHFSVVLREHHPQAVVYESEHKGVRNGLHQDRLTRRQGQQHTRGQQHEQKHGDDNVKVHFISYARQFLQEFDSRLRAHDTCSAIYGRHHGCVYEEHMA